ncbi:MAG: hypothetical protein WDM89_15605 [Rhizomicrobium sp.]
MDEEGFCYIIDRAKDMLIRGGENIYCIEVENVLYEHPAVMDAALVAVPHKQLGRGAWRGGASEAGPAYDGGRATRLRRGQARGVQGAGEGGVLAETLPRNANGKILKTELKKIFAA